MRLLLGPLVSSSVVWKDRRIVLLRLLVVLSEMLGKTKLGLRLWLRLLMKWYLLWSISWVY